MKSYDFIPADKAEDLETQVFEAGISLKIQRDKKSTKGFRVIAEGSMTDMTQFDEILYKIKNGVPRPDLKIRKEVKAKRPIQNFFKKLLEK